MKIKLNQLMEDENGKPIQPVLTKPPLCLRDIIVNSLLTPSQNENEKDKATKYDVFKKLRNERSEVDLKSEEITLIKSCIAKHQPQLIMGEAHEMIEGTYERIIIPKEDGSN